MDNGRYPQKLIYHLLATISLPVYIQLFFQFFFANQVFLSIKQKIPDFVYVISGRTGPRIQIKKFLLKIDKLRTTHQVIIICIRQRSQFYRTVIRHTGRSIRSTTSGDNNNSIGTSPHKLKRR